MIILLHVSTFLCHHQEVLHLCLVKIHKFLTPNLLKLQFHKIIQIFAQGIMTLKGFYCINKQRLINISIYFNNFTKLKFELLQFSEFM